MLDASSSVQNGFLTGPPVPVVAQGSTVPLPFLETEMFGDLLLEELIHLDLRLIRHSTKFSKHRDVSRICFPTLVLQFVNKCPSTVWSDFPVKALEPRPTGWEPPI